MSSARDVCSCCLLGLLVPHPRSRPGGPARQEPRLADGVGVHLRRATATTRARSLILSQMILQIGADYSVDLAGAQLVELALLVAETWELVFPFSSLDILLKQAFRIA